MPEIKKCVSRLTGSAEVRSLHIVGCTRVGVISWGIRQGNPLSCTVWGLLVSVQNKNIPKYVITAFEFHNRDTNNLIHAFIYFVSSGYHMYSKIM